MAMIIANLSYTLIQIIPYLASGGHTNFQAWALGIADILGIIGAFWLIREERRRRRIGKAKETQEAEGREEA